MKAFRDNQRVVVTDNKSPFLGKTGTVVRRRMADSGAWVRMDEDLPPDLRAFPADDRRGRANYVLLYPDWCKRAPTAPAPRPEAKP